MSIVTLVSGGLDSTVMALLIKEEGLEQLPLILDYGQLNVKKELGACQLNFQKFNLPSPAVIHLSEYGGLISSGLTDPSKRIFEDAFLPCRNLLFLTVGAAYAFQRGADSIAIGLLDDAFSLFPDQTRGFVQDAESLVSRCLGRSLRVITPLMSFSKAEVVSIARAKRIRGTYSCHAGTDEPCGKCVACREYIGLEV